MRPSEDREAMLSMRLLTDKQLQEELQVERVYLWRKRKEGMPYYRLGSRTIRYSLSDVLGWLEERKAASGASEGQI